MSCVHPHGLGSSESGLSEVQSPCVGSFHFPVKQGKEGRIGELDFRCPFEAMELQEETLGLFKNHPLLSSSRWPPHSTRIWAMSTIL